MVFLLQDVWHEVLILDSTQQSLCIFISLRSSRTAWKNIHNLWNGLNVHNPLLIKCLRVRCDGFHAVRGWAMTVLTPTEGTTGTVSKSSVFIITVIFFHHHQFEILNSKCFLTTRLRKIKHLSWVSGILARFEINTCQVPMLICCLLRKSWRDLPHWPVNVCTRTGLIHT